MHDVVVLHVPVSKQSIVPGPSTLYPASQVTVPEVPYVVPVGNSTSPLVIFVVPQSEKLSFANLYFFDFLKMFFDCKMN